MCFEQTKLLPQNFGADQVSVECGVDRIVAAREYAMICDDGKTRLCKPSQTSSP